MKTSKSNACIHGSILLIVTLKQAANVCSRWIDLQNLTNAWYCAMRDIKGVVIVLQAPTIDWGIHTRNGAVVNRR